LITAGGSGIGRSPYKWTDPFVRLGLAPSRRNGYTYVMTDTGTRPLAGDYEIPAGCRDELLAHDVSMAARRPQSLWARGAAEVAAR
jgi:hypothetical protein